MTFASLSHSCRYKSADVYQYHATADFPYILGCFKGKPHGITIRPDFCYFASDADENGNIPRVAHVMENHLEEADKVDVADDAQPEEEHLPHLPSNLWQRRLPKNYIEWLSKKVFADVA